MRPGCGSVGTPAAAKTQEESMKRSRSAGRTRRRSLVAALLALSAMVVALTITVGASANTPVSGAAFTTVNESVDGSDHCKNGNPNVNCNIYDGKQYVWLNGGPSVAYVGDGDYFFAVLEPGGQADPNDGGANNLSDNYDAYTNRTFTVSGGVVSYGGSHDNDSNKIRLMPYADTSNPGGVYILAICSLADTYPVNPSDCKYDAFKIQEGEVVFASDLSITKDAAGSYDNTFAWTIGKDVDKTLVKQVGGSATFNYTVTVSHDAGTVGNVAVSGGIQVFNPNVDSNSATVPVDIDSVTDQLSDSTACSVTGGGAQTLSLFETDFAYSCSLSGLPQGQLDNTAAVTWPSQFLSNGSFLDGNSADFTFSDIPFSENTIDECVAVTDSYAGTLGTVCDGDANPSTFTYQRIVSVPASGCQSYDNTATFTTNDTGATDSASQTVTVCGPANNSALTIGFWKNTNGNSLIQNYCAPAGKTSLATYLSSLGGGSGPFSDAAGKSCSQLVTYVNNIIKGANSTNMNTMLKAQMLATALDVYFSDPNLGYTSTSLNKTKPPSNFLTHGALGGFNMDMTAICPMIDNTTAGTATCKNNMPSTNAFASGAVPSAAMTVQAILTYAATTPSPFNGSTSNSIWYGGNRTLEEVLKNIFDQINNNDAFAA
jgi:hypothetical protein